VQTVVQFVDDLDGAEAAETVLFGLDGVGYEVDLSAVNAAELRALLRPYVAAARPTGRVVAGSANRVRHAIARANRPRPADPEAESRPGATPPEAVPSETVPARTVPPEPSAAAADGRSGPVTDAGPAADTGVPAPPRPAEAGPEVARVRFSDQTAR
jgi:hypothetical protein